MWSLTERTYRRDQWRCRRRHEEIQRWRGSSTLSDELMCRCPAESKEIKALSEGEGVFCRETLVGDTKRTQNWLKSRGNSRVLIEDKTRRTGNRIKTRLLGLSSPRSLFFCCRLVFVEDNQVADLNCSAQNLLYKPVLLYNSNPYHQIPTFIILICFMGLKFCSLDNIIYDNTELWIVFSFPKHEVVFMPESLVPKHNISSVVSELGQWWESLWN